MFEYTRDSALIVVDVQNDFADPAGGLYVRGGEEIVAGINEEIVRAGAGGWVVYTQDWHPESTPHFAKDGGVWPTHCVRDTWGAELHPQLLQELGGMLIRKGVNGEDGYSGFSYRNPLNGVEGSTELLAHLNDVEVRRVMVVGIAGDVCVKATALDAQRLGFETHVRWDLTRSVNLRAGDDAFALEELQAAGVIVE